MERITFMLLLFLVAVTCCYCTPIVATSSGLVKGRWGKSYKGYRYSAFEGIPYALPPVGNLRFEPPEEYTRWRGIWRANTQHTCLQVETVGEEDCLYLNVYVPRKWPNRFNNLNVIVHIHGGAFMIGSGHQYAGPKYLMDADVILVTMNYRLGPFGFLSTEDKVVPGNNGMKDQVLALKWIQKNIKFFGGNPNSVTITGMSAGGASVHLHYFSPLSKDLFHRGSSESGTALNPWVIQEGALEKAKKLANLLNCPQDNSSNLINCLKTRSGYEIVEVIKEFSPVLGYPISPFAPVIEKQHDGAFLTKQPYKMLLDKSVSNIPWIVSVAKEEGSLFALLLKEAISEIQKNFTAIAPYLLDYIYTIPEEEKIRTSNKIKNRYFKDKFSVEDLAKLLGDRLFYAGADIAAKLQAKANKAPVYFYILKYKGENSFGEMLELDTEDIGVSHGDSVLYYLNTPISSEVLTRKDANMVSIFTSWLTHYANDRKPKITNGVDWKAVKGDDPLQYLSVESPNKISMKEIRDLGSNSFWEQIPFKENGNL